MSLRAAIKASELEAAAEAAKGGGPSLVVSVAARQHLSRGNLRHCSLDVRGWLCVTLLRWLSGSNRAIFTL